MTSKRAYTYIVVRYVHDIVTSEFINIGVLLYLPSQGVLKQKIKTSIGRIKGAFPDLNRHSYVESVRALRRGINALAHQEESRGFNLSDLDAAELARKALPTDDSSLQWSASGSGLTDNIDATLERLYERFVTKYDHSISHRRSDEDVWRPVRLKLEERKIADRLHEKRISGAIDEIDFKHAWKNGKWHVYEPVSFDLAEADSIKAKAREWLGHLSAVVAGDGIEKFQPHFLVGAPSDPKLLPAFEIAVTILGSAPNSPEIYDEGQIDDLVAQIEGEIHAHDQGGRR